MENLRCGMPYAFGYFEKREDIKDTVSNGNN